MGCSIGNRLKARIFTPSYFWKGGTAISQSREASELAQYVWGREGAECNGDHWGLQLFTVSLSLSDEILMSLWIFSSKNILARGYECRIYKYIRDM